jgi:hypothetical protein
LTTVDQEEWMMSASKPFPSYLEENASAEQKRFLDRLRGRESRVPRRKRPTTPAEATPAVAQAATPDAGHEPAVPGDATGRTRR